MIDLPPPTTPAGWYPDGVPEQERWWDGTGWTERTRGARSDAATPEPTATGVRVVRGATGYAELDGDVLLFRSKPDRPALQRIPLNTVDDVVVSRSGNAFDVVRHGARPRRRPGLLSETSLQRGGRTSPDEWRAFLDALSAAVAAAVPKFPADAD
ncbi:hypothetical protein AS850_07775 [Frondihabitans sp. 762G35]|uniref:DUF2510 domain-containing protein n=1 Tax=Frondihabitans sp. 762G35 TaxID=1446794 RepID=UPI000D20FD5A|nr:DUF2510 domain-containing protein [Frondihabitans sp. 762G35]ARC56975.1 hypothetical protein AS850_07775 [Frondihabitans sp. 762G35]